MKYAIIFLLFALNAVAVETRAEEMTCVEILDTIKKLEKYKEESERGNYEGVERVAAAVLTRTVYIGDRRNDGQRIDIKKEIISLRAKLPDCKPY